MNVMCVDLEPLAFLLHFASQLYIASKLVCSLREAMAGSLSVAIIAVSSAKVADLVSGEIGTSIGGEFCILIFSLDEDILQYMELSGQIHAHAILTPDAHWAGSWMGLRAGLYVMEKKR
jgi:hypothetical protein